MKTRYIIAAASALLLLAGCSREMDFQTPGSNVLKAVIESGETRVSFDEMGKFAWDEGDKIAVYVGNAFEEVEVEAATGAFRIETSGDRSFYAIYPANVAPATNASLTVTLPASYDISSVTDADYSPVPMVAQNIQGQDELYFLHVGGLVRIFGENPTGATTAVVTFDKDVTGTYTVDTSNPSNPTITTGGNATNNTVTYTLPSGRNFVLNIPVPCGTYESVKIALGDDNPVQLNTTPLTFARHHGKTLVIGEVTFTYELEGLHEVIAEYLGGSKELAQAFSSYKTPDGGATKVGVPFEIEFSEDGETGWSTTGAPDWLSVADGVDYSGSTTGEPLHLVITPQLNTAVDYHALELQSRPEKTNFDLSTYNVATGATVARTTANSYVVDAPGTYKFPIVYGNGVKGGEINEPAWHATDNGAYRTSEWTTGTCNDLVEPYSSKRGMLNYFKDHRDNDITSPYILKHFENLGYTQVTLTPEIMWMDALSNNGTGLKNGRLLVQDVRIEGSGENAYIVFDVPAESIQQGNVGIALKATYTVGTGENAQTFTDVVWSWHIWVTDHDLKAVDGPDGVKFSPTNIGWRDTREIARYDERVWYVRVKQTEEGGTTSEALKVTSRAGNITIESGGRSLRYVFGRKEPFAGTYLKTVGTADPKPTTGSFYVGYDLPEAYITSAGSVPEMKEKWLYSDYLPASEKKMVTNGTLHVCKNVTLAKDYTFEFIKDGDVEQNLGGVGSYTLDTEFDVKNEATGGKCIAILAADTYDIILDPENKKAKIIKTLVVEGEADPYASYTQESLWSVVDYGIQNGYTKWDDPATTQKEEITLVLRPTIGLGIRYPRAGFGGTRIHSWLNCTWHNLWDSSISGQAANNVSETNSTKTIYDPCPVGYKIPTPDCFSGLTTANTEYAEIEGVPGRKYSDDLFIPFIPQTGSKTELGRYSFAVQAGTNSRSLFDIYPEYVYGRTSESMSGSYVVRPVQE